MVRIVLIFHPETQGNIADLQRSGIAVLRGTSAFLPGFSCFPAPTSFIFKCDPKMGLDTHRTDPCGVMGAKDCAQAGWLLVGLSPGVAASLQPGPEGLHRSQPGTPRLSRPQHNQSISKSQEDNVHTSHPPAQTQSHQSHLAKKTKAPPLLGRGSALPTPPSAMVFNLNNNNNKKHLDKLHKSYR